MDGSKQYDMISSRPRFRQPTRFMYLTVFVLVLGVVLTVLNIYELHRMKSEHVKELEVYVEGSLDGKASGPIVWVEGKNKHSGYLFHVFNVFKGLGYVPGDHRDDWTVAWMHDYPFNTFANELGKLKKHQRVNHFPGSGYVTNKVSLATTSLDFIPRAYKLPTEKDAFLDFSAKHPEVMWVQKSNSHRGIRILNTAQIELDKDGSFVQQYVDKPFLIDGHKFDIGIYTIVTSINPLRVYTVDDDALFRFCPEKYYPFDATARDKYVVHDDYRPLWKMDSLRNLYSDKGYNFKVTFNEYLKAKGYNYQKVWTDIVSAIRQVFVKKEPKLIDAAAKWGGTEHFFEMMRFDFVLDDKLNVYLMEANMSPNLSSKHFPPNKRLYEHVIFTLLSLAGMTEHTVSGKMTFDEDMLVAPTDVRVFPDVCAREECNHACKLDKCKLCWYCVKKNLERDFKRAYLEHNRRMGARRILPPPLNVTQVQTWDPSTPWPGLETLSEKNQLMFMWFVGKCRMDHSFCD